MNRSALATTTVTTTATATATAASTTSNAANANADATKLVPGNADAKSSKNSCLSARKTGPYYTSKKAMARNKATAAKKLPPWEAPLHRRQPLPSLPYQREMYWPVGQFTIRQYNCDVGKTCDLGSQGMVSGAFTKTIQPGQMRPPTLAVGGMPPYSMDAYNDVLRQMLGAHQRTGE